MPSRTFPPRTANTVMVIAFAITMLSSILRLSTSIFRPSKSLKDAQAVLPAFGRRTERRIHLTTRHGRAGDQPAVVGEHHGIDSPGVLGGGGCSRVGFGALRREEDRHADAQESAEQQGRFLDAEGSEARTMGFRTTGWVAWANPLR